jgi:exo-beta-1,3-glucanase (GH17 family)/cellulose synthase/poly-beta-1,6-N-acetylglucosamine synthase-like glycosyltransferase
MPLSRTQRILSSLLVALIFAGVTYGLWAYMNQPTQEPPWPKRIQGFAFSPYRIDQDATLDQLPSEEQLAEDLAVLAGKTVSVRTYSTIGSVGEVPRIAWQQKPRIKVALGTWLDKRTERNEEEIQNAIRIAGTQPNIIRVFVGNESVLRGDLTVTELAAYLDRVRAAVDKPVSTAEPWHVWLAHPELANHVDFIGVHMLPYWEGVNVLEANDYIDDKMNRLEAAFPGKRIIIGEVGWPSDGRTREKAVASPANEALFLRRFIARAKEEKYVYYVMEAFDQPWKSAIEGSVGAYWGVYDVNRKPKFEFVDPIIRIPEWHVLAGLSVVTSALLLGAMYMFSGSLGTRGRSFLAAVVYTTATITVLIIYDYSQKYLTITGVLVGTLLIIGMLGLIAVLLAEAHEWAEARWDTGRQRLLQVNKSSNAAVAAGSASGAVRKVSIHVPAYNEPPQMLIETLDALARLDYPDFEVLVIDNNTQDEKTWRPVETHCLELGSRFRFFHVSPLAGFKAGALNFALRQTAPDAEVVAVIDSDYKVEPTWLKELVPAFDNPRTAIVQAPQDYRDADDNLFKAMCHAEYRGFFQIGMVTRNERNAIIQHGTMTLVRRTVLESVEGWAEWCITEDADLGLKIFEAGFEAAYVPTSYGRGVMPDTFIDFKKQRFRWAYGAMQILRAHTSSLFSHRDQRLTAGQRYHFIAGWLPWIADGLNLLFNALAIGWTVAMIIAPARIEPPLLMFSVLPLSLFTFKLVKLIHLYVTHVKANFRQTFSAALAGLALSHTIGLATVKGLITKDEPFFRTPKQAQPHAFAAAVAAARQESLLMLALWLAALGLQTVPEELSSPDLSVWTAVLLIQSIPYAAALVVSLISAFNLPARWLGSTPSQTVGGPAEQGGQP